MLCHGKERSIFLIASIVVTDPLELTPVRALREKLLML